MGQTEQEPARVERGQSEGPGESADLPPAYLVISDEGDQCIVRRFADEDDAWAYAESLARDTAGNVRGRVLPAALAEHAMELRDSLRRMTEAFHPVRWGSIGAPGSQARNEQEEQIAAHNEASWLLKRLEQPAARGRAGTAADRQPSGGERCAPAGGGPAACRRHGPTLLEIARRSEAEGGTLRPNWTLLAAQLAEIRARLERTAAYAADVLAATPRDADGAFDVKGPACSRAAAACRTMLECMELVLEDCRAAFEVRPRPLADPPPIARLGQGSGRLDVFG